jgi:hypothetical protein
LLVTSTKPRMCKTIEVARTISREAGQGHL